MEGGKGVGGGGAERQTLFSPCFWSFQYFDGSLQRGEGVCMCFCGRGGGGDLGSAVDQCSMRGSASSGGYVGAAHRRQICGGSASSADTTNLNPKP